MSYLIYVNGLGPNYKGDNLYEFIFSDEIDIEFKGEIFVRIFNENRTWHDSKILTSKKVSVSKIKLNRYIRKTSINDIRMRMRYFGVNIDDYRYVNKIKWS